MKFYLIICLSLLTFSLGLKVMAQDRPPRPEDKKLPPKTEKKIINLKEDPIIKEKEDQILREITPSTITYLGKTYQTVDIGNQTWLNENLDVEYYRNGDPIPQVQDKDRWVSLKTGAWCYYDNSPENGKKYGKLYNWYAVNDSRGLAPEGWHIPSKEEFETLKAGVNSNSNSLKAAGQQAVVGTVGTNASLFSALYMGARVDGNFYALGLGAYFWSSTDYYIANFAYYLSIGYLSTDINLIPVYKVNGYSVRCLKD